MKKIIILAISFLLLVPTVSAQKKKKNNTTEFDFELRGGLNFCQIDGDGSGNYNKIGFHGAVNTSLPVSDDGRWRFLVEIGVTQKGSHITNSDMNRIISIIYVEVPLLIAYDFLEQANLRVGAGLAPAILAHSKVTTDNVFDNDQSKNYKRIDALPICISARYSFNKHLGIDFRWYNSLLNTAKENASGTYRIFRSNKGQFNRLLTAGITLDF